MVQPGRRAWMVVLLVGLVGTHPEAQAQAPRPGEVAARDSAQIQGNGPRRGDEGRTYANIQGTGSNPRFASYAIFDFPMPRGANGKDKDATVTLFLTQSVTRFTRDGKLRLFLLDDAKSDLDALTQNLRFEPARVPDGLGNNLPKLIPVGTFDFLKGGMGDTDPIPLTLDDAGRKLVADRAASGGSLRVVIVPDIPHVAATYFGAGARDAENRPRLAIGPAAPTPRP